MYINYLAVSEIIMSSFYSKKFFFILGVPTRNKKKSHPPTRSRWTFYESINTPASVILTSFVIASFSSLCYTIRREYSVQVCAIRLVFEVFLPLAN